MRNNGIISQNEYVGKTYQDAKKYAEEGGFITRIVEENGNSFIYELDNKSNRLNFRIKNNIVTDVYGG
jgi:hypothetical protein